MKQTAYKSPVRPTACPRCKRDLAAPGPFCPHCHFDLSYGSPSPTKIGDCIYCGTRCRYSREHIYGKWIRDMFGARHTSVVHMFTRPEEFVDVWPPGTMQSNVETHQGSLYDQVVLNVCETCNNEWMSRLQTAARPLVTELATATWRTFSPDDQAVLTRWIVMVAINLQCHARQLFATGHQRNQLMHGARPNGWQVFAGTMLDDRFGGRHFNRSMLTAIGLGEDESVPLVCCYFVIERAVFLAFSSIGDRTLEVALLGSGAHGRPMPLRSLQPEAGVPEGTGWMFVSLDQVDAIQGWFGAVDPMRMNPP